MHRHNGAGILGQHVFKLINVDRIIIRINIAKDGPKTASNYGMGRRYKSKGSRYNIPFKSHGLQGHFKRQMTVHKQFNIGHLKIILKLTLKLLMLGPHICQPVRIPYRLYLVDIFIQAGHG